MTELTKTQQLLLGAVTASIPQITGMIQGINDELSRSEGEPQEWHAQMLRLRMGIVGIARARFGFAWQRGRPPQ